MLICDLFAATQESKTAHPEQLGEAGWHAKNESFLGAADPTLHR